MIRLMQFPRPQRERRGHEIDGIDLNLLASIWNDVIDQQRGHKNYMNIINSANDFDWHHVNVEEGLDVIGGKKKKKVFSISSLPSVTRLSYW